MTVQDIRTILTLYPLAVERIRTDLDDGVKRKYPKFPGVLRLIKGLNDEDCVFHAMTGSHSMGSWAGLTGSQTA